MIHKMLLLVLWATCLVESDEIDIEKLLDCDLDQNEQSVVLDYLNSLIETPLNVNEASAKQLCTLPWLSPTLAVRLVDYRYRNGAFKDINDIKKVRGLRRIFDKIYPFISVGSRRIFSPVHVRGRHRLSYKVEDSKAFQQRIYVGSKYKVYNRLECSTAHLQLGMLGEKDSGERAWNDHMTGYVLAKVPFLATQVIAGAFSASFGQGLVFGGSYKMSKGSNPIAPAKQRSRGLQPCLSAAENKNFYGVAVSSRFKGVQVYAFSSRNKRDARIEGDFVLSQPQTGLHRTVSEVSVRDQLAENVHGVSIELNSRHGRIGFSRQENSYRNFFPQKDGLQACQFNGRQNSVSGGFLDFSIGAMNAFGEAAQSRSWGRAFVGGVWYDLSPLEMVALFRFYDRHFHNFYACGFGERDQTRNEKGLYFGLCYHLSRNTNFSFFLDQYASTWPQTLEPMPSSGFDMLCSIEHQFSSSLSAFFRFKTDKKEIKVTIPDEFGNPIRAMQWNQRSSFRLQLNVVPQKTIRLCSRLEFSASDWNAPAEIIWDKIGTMLYQDIRWRPAQFCSFRIRWIVFDVPSYSLRIYQYENDLPGVMCSKMLIGRGKRWYVLLSSQIVHNFRLNFKYENTLYDDRETIGSGNDVINSSSENRLAFQLAWHF